MAVAQNSESHQQESDFALLLRLARHVEPTFVDVGAERGVLARQLIDLGLTGYLFEPLPEHRGRLEELVEDNDSRFFPWAVDSFDHAGQLHVACGEDGEPLDYHHSLIRLDDDPRVHHERSVEVTCRSLDSLAETGEIPLRPGILKVDTEGNDEAVLAGLGRVRPQVVMCEFMTSGLYEGWDGSRPERLIERAREQGFRHVVSLRRVDDAELIVISPNSFGPGQWGNLVFVEDSVWKPLAADIEALAAKSAEALLVRYRDAQQELREKEASIQGMAQQLLEKEALINGQETARLEHDETMRRGETEIARSREAEARASERAARLESEIAVLRERLEETEKRLDRAARKSARIKTEVEEKEAVIGELKEALGSAPRRRRRALPRLSAVLPSSSSLRSRLAHAKPIALLRRWLSPRLGVLVHHPPKELELPPPYEPRASSTGDPLPRISIVTPSYNQAKFLPRTLASVLDQGYPRLEYVVMDGASTDGSVAVLEEFRDRLAHCESAPDGGQADAVDRGLAKTSGEIMAYLNSDDLLLPGALHYVGEYFRSHPEVDAVYGHRILIDDDDLEIGRWVLPAHDDGVLSWADYVPQETLFWRRELWERAGGRMDVSFRFALDWDLLLRFRDAGARIVRLPRFLGAFRIHDSQKTSAAIDDVGNAEMARLRHRCHGRNVTHREIAAAIRPYLWRHIVLHSLYRRKLLRY